ncbi:MAG TPA: hypothetical protein PK245_04445, partial [Clostridia bacterium]|nr:hypothetical protein [Clostridia bacterium]
TAVASNFGYIQIRQDEGTPKFLTDYDEKNNQYGGGFGYLVTEDGVLPTYYGGGEMRREYGAGYFLKKTENGKSKVEELLFAPFGDDPVIFKKVTVTNNSDEETAYRWYDYWAGEMYQFSFVHFVLAQATFNTANVSKLRRAFARSFEKELSAEAFGVSQKWVFDKSKKPMVNALTKLGRSVLAKTAARFYDMGGANPVDYTPPEVLVTGISKTAGYLSDADAFFGKGGALKPDFLFKKPDAVQTKDRKNGMLMPYSDFTLKAGESIELAYAYFYFPNDKNKGELIKKYMGTDINAVFLKSAEARLSDGVNADIEGLPWLSRELVWHNAYLREGMSYFDFYGAHVLSQGGHYQYLMGLQGAPRDQLQHSLPFIYTDEKVAREHILFTLKQMSPAGELPYATTGNGMLIALVMVPSDLQLMLLSYAGEYILATRDFDFLKSKYTVKQCGKTVEKTVLEGLLLAYSYATKEVGKGPHGLLRMKSGDWNDQAVYGRVPLSQTKKVRKVGESMLNSAMGIYSFKTFSEMLRAAGESAAAEESEKWSKELKEAVKAQWNGKWFKRAWMGDKVGWLGDDLLWLEPQPWAIIGGAADENLRGELVKNINDILMKDSPNGAALIQKSSEREENSAGLDAGVLENGGIWYAINGYLVWALAKEDGGLAFDEFLKNTRAYQAEAYPEIWYGIWSGPDSVNSVAAKYPGRTQNSKNPITGKREKFFKLTVGVDWEDFPVLNLHAHTWQQYALFKLIGLEFNATGFKIKPVIPKEKYQIRSRLFSFSRDGKSFRGVYRPLEGGKTEIEADLGAAVKSLKVNGESRKADGLSSVIKFEAQGGEIEFEIVTE